MPSKYRPRPLQIKVCQHCNFSFESAHKRTIYCSNSCRTLAYIARQELEPSKPELVLKPLKTELAFSAQNIGVTTFGSGISVLANAVINDFPAQEKLLKRILDLADQVTANHRYVVAQLDHQHDFIEAMKGAQPNLSWSIAAAASQRNLQIQQKEASKSEIMAKGKVNLAKRQAEGRFR